MKKQTYIQNICSIIFAQSVDMRKYVRYNNENQEQMFATNVRVFVSIQLLYVYYIKAKVT